MMMMMTDILITRLNLFPFNYPVASFMPYLIIVDEFHDQNMLYLFTNYHLFKTLIIVNECRAVLLKGFYVGG